MSNHPISTVAGQAIHDAAQKYNISPSDIKGRRVFRHYVDARMEVAVELSAKGWSVSQIARALGRNHTTILSLLGRVKKREGQRRARKSRLAALRVKERQAEFDRVQAHD